MVETDAVMNETQKKPRVSPLVKVLVSLAVMLSVIVAGYLWLCASINSYDQRFADCMNAQQNQLYPRGEYWPTDAYNAAMASCERSAGVPLPETTVPFHDQP